MELTIVTMYQRIDAESFVGVVAGRLTTEQKEAIRKAYKGAGPDDDPDCEI